MNYGVDCVAYHREGLCTHPFAPRRVFGKPRCVETINLENGDVRIYPIRCHLKITHKEARPPFTPPPKRP